MVEWADVTSGRSEDRRPSPSWADEFAGLVELDKRSVGVELPDEPRCHTLEVGQPAQDGDDGSTRSAANLANQRENRSS